MLKKMMLSVAAATVLAAVGTLTGVWSHRADAAPEVGSGAISLPAINDTQPIYTHTGPIMASVTVKVTAGELTAENFDGGVWTAIGTLASGQATTFEGPYTQIRVKAVMPGTLGTYVNRRPTDVAGSDHYIGTSTVTLGGTPVRIYAGPTGTYRHVMLQAGSGSVSLRISSSGPDIETVEAEESLYFNGANQEYWLSGSGVVTFFIYDALAVPAAAKVEVLKWDGDSDGDIDTIYRGGGTQCVKFIITNTSSSSSGPVKIHSKRTGDTEETVDEVDAGEPITVECNLLYIKVEFPKKGGKCEATQETVTTNP